MSVDFKSFVKAHLKDYLKTINITDIFSVICGSESCQPFSFLHMTGDIK